MLRTFLQCLFSDSTGIKYVDIVELLLLLSKIMWILFHHWTADRVRAVGVLLYTLTYVWLTLMCSNSRSVSTLTDWLMIRSREEFALCADSSLPCGSHCLQRSTNDLQDTHTHTHTHTHRYRSEAGLWAKHCRTCWAERWMYLRGGQQLTRAMVLETYPSPRSPNSLWVSWNISTFLWKLDTHTERIYLNPLNFNTVSIFLPLRYSLIEKVSQSDQTTASHSGS